MWNTVPLEYCSIETRNRVVFILMLLLLSIGCALRLPSLFRLTHSHQWLFADSRGFFLREYHSNGCGKINPSNCHLQYVYWVTDMTFDPLELENWIRTRTQPFRSLFDSTRRMELSYLPFMAWVTEDDSVPEHKCKWLSLLSIVDSPRAPINSSNALDHSSLHTLIVIVLIIFQE